MTAKEIARRVGLGRRTMQSWLAHETYPETHYHLRRHHSQFDAFEAYVQQRWDAGEHNIQQLWREIQAQGYPHSARALRNHLESLRGTAKTAPPAESVLGPVSAKEAVWLFIRDNDALEEQERGTLVAIRQASPTADQLYPLVQEFVRLVRTRSGERIDAWLCQVRGCPFRDLRRFAAGLERDRAAVQAGVTLQDSNGPTEGFVNKLKLVKRTMYGRAGFPLLRQRLLHAL